MQTNQPAGSNMPATNPKFVVDDSPLKASIVTILSLSFFGITLAGAILHLASARDLNGIRALLMREDVIGWATTAAPFIWAGYRAVRSWLNKKRDVEIVQAAPDEKAMLKSEVAAAKTAAPPPTRAPETTTATRLVDGKVLLHRGGLVAPPAVSAAALTPTAEDAASVQELMEKTMPAEPAQVAGQARNADFDAMYNEWAAAGSVEGFPEFLESRGWVYTDGTWQIPEGEK